MPGLWADGWFYISSAGLLVSGALFFFLLGQYRAAADAADEAHADEPIETPATVPVRPVYIPDDSEPTRPLPAAAPAAAAQAPAAAPEPAPAKKEPAAGSGSTGGISPAVVYMQNLKLQMDEVEVEVRGLAKKVAAVSERDDALIERLGELTRAVEELKGLVLEPPTPKRRKTDKAPAAAPEPAAPAPEPEPAPAPAAEPVAEMKLAAPEPAAAPEPVAAAPASEPEPAPAPAAQTEPSAPPAAGLTIELGTAAGTGAPVDAPAPSPDATMRVEDLKAALEQQGEKAEEEKPRRGPVWPV
jgi:pyruvate dehydrogenase E2 component (dihydrolipoamide acetyltransferase)